MLAPHSSKVTDRHLGRQAIIYVRQSTFLQVRQHTGSTTRQYDLQHRAQELGWPQANILVIDQDQGQSGASATTREGFQWLVAEVGLGHVGAIFCREASRLARSCSDWYRLLEICALSQTLVIDEEGLYDPGFYNDRLLLGFKGTMSEAELHWLRQRLDGGKQAKAQRGELRCPLPVGLVYDPTGQICFDPDEQVREAVEIVFSSFMRCRSALAVVRYFHQHDILFPTRPRGSQELEWKPLTHSRVRQILHNPFYAGAYVYGRLESTPGRTEGRKWRKPQDWPIVLLEHHPGYINWEQYLHHRLLLEQNCTHGFEARPGAVREGAALLQGLLICGNCGHRMRVHYPKGVNGPVYVCNYRRITFGEPTCQTRQGTDLDQAIVTQFLEALEPVQREISLATLNQVESQLSQLEHQWQLRRERAEYESNLARRRYMAVDPDNRLVARSLEQEWNQRLESWHQVQRDYLFWKQEYRLHEGLSESDRSQILQLAHDVPTLWNLPTLSQAERKQLLRFLIHSVTLSHHPSGREVDICWQTQAHTTFILADRPLSYDKYRTDPRLVEEIRHLASDHTDREICVILSEQGRSNAHGTPLTVARIRGIRRDFKIMAGSPERPGWYGYPQRPDGRYSVREVATMFQVNPSTIHEWCKLGR
jgi:DNA invertase Pin-like site-specific DNA recombinase